MKRLLPYFLLLALGAILGGMLFLSVGKTAAPEPGSEADPLVTKSYVESYFQGKLEAYEGQVSALAARVVTLEKEVANLKKEVAALKGGLPNRGKEIILTIGSRTAMVEGKSASLPAAPFLVAGTAMLPFRFLGEALGAKVSYEAATKTVTYEQGDQLIRLQIDSLKAVVNGREVSLNVAPRLINGVTFVPLRFVSENLGAEVTWDGASQKIIITF